MPYLGVLLLELLAQVVLLLLEHRSAGPREEGGAAGEHLERVGEVVALVDGDAPGCYVCVYVSYTPDRIVWGEKSRTCSIKLPRVHAKHNARTDVGRVPEVGETGHEALILGGGGHLAGLSDSVRETPVSDVESMFSQEGDESIFRCDTTTIPWGARRPCPGPARAAGPCTRSAGCCRGRKRGVVDCVISDVDIS